jgi:F-type H+-transporting ATPase subunit a
MPIASGILAELEIPEELPNIITLIARAVGPESSLGHFLEHWQDQIFAGVVIILLCTVFAIGTRNRTRVPGRLQTFLEMVTESLDNLIVSVIGPQGRRFTPFIGTLFLYIISMNLFGLIPLMKSPTGGVGEAPDGTTLLKALNMTLALSLTVFVYVQFMAFKNLGVGGYLYHLAGEPKGIIGWALVPLMFPIHLMGELARPLTLALRLFGNITSEDKLLAIFVWMGVVLLAFINSPIGLPLHAVMYVLLLIFSFVQALVFSLLTTVYFALTFPHHEEHEAAH